MLALNDPMKKPLPPLFFLAALVLIGTLHAVLPGAPLLTGLWRLAGLPLLLIGIALNLIADRAFKRHGTTIRPFERSTALVTEGVFAYSRNPIYLGMTLILAGLALAAGSATPWIVVGLFAVGVDRAFIVAEERMLEETFGEEFRRYRQTVRRWL